MSRLLESKKQFIEELKKRGAQAGKAAADDMEYEPLWKLKKADERGEIVNAQDLLRFMELDADELFGDEWNDECDEPEFIAAWIAGAVGVLDAAG